MNDSKFNMWRTITSLAHADGVFCRDEKNYLEPLFEELEMTDEQRATLKSDIKTPQDSKKLFELITSPGDRAQVTYFGRILMWADADFEKSEEEMLNSMRDLALEKVDMDLVMSKVNKVSADFAAQDEQRKADRPLHRKILDAIVFWEDLP